MSQHLSYRPDVDGLRAVAVLSVLFHHAGLSAPGGFVGVDVFFVISGYLIAGLIRKDLAAGTFSLADFWARRVRRLFPALAVVVAVTLVAGWRLMLPQHYVSLAHSVWALFSLIANVHFCRSTGYFEQAAEVKPLLHTWSLAVEEQFYLVVPLVMWWLGRRGRTRALVRLSVVALGVSFVISVLGTQRHNPSAFYYIHSRAWELLVGTLLAFCPAAGGAGRSWRGELAALAGLAGIIVPVFLYDRSTPFPGFAAVPPVLGAALLIWAGGRAGPLPAVNRLLAAAPVVFVGKISYSLYLWHWPLIVFAKYYSLGPLSVADRLGLVAASVVAGAISWRFVETPFRVKRLLGARPRLVAGAAAALAVLVGAAVAIDHADGVPSRLPAAAREYAAAGIMDPRYTRGIESSDVANNLMRFGDADAPAGLLVWGDSYAMAVLPAIDTLAQKTGIPARAATRADGAPIADYVPPYPGARSARTRDYNDAVLAHLRAEHYDAVLLASRWHMHLAEAGATEKLLKTMEDIRAAGPRVYFMREVPTYPFDVPLTLTRYAMRGRDPADLALPTHVHDPVEAMYAELRPLLAERGVTVLDPLPYFRAKDDPDRILPFNAGGSFYRDTGHLSGHGAATLEPMFEPVFEEIRRRRLAPPPK